MLALYVKDNKVCEPSVLDTYGCNCFNSRCEVMITDVLQIPVDLHDKEFLPILQEEPLPPLALVSFTEEEQVGLLALASGLLCEHRAG